MTNIVPLPLCRGTIRSCYDLDYMTTYNRGYVQMTFPAAQEAREKRKQVLTAVRKRRRIMYKRFVEKLQQKSIVL
jgi:hypothetical protein